jgi:hypothetical protein
MCASRQILNAMFGAEGGSCAVTLWKWTLKGISHAISKVDCHVSDRIPARSTKGCTAHALKGGPACQQRLKGSRSDVNIAVQEDAVNAIFQVNNLGTVESCGERRHRKSGTCHFQYS